MRLAERVARLEQNANGAADQYSRDAAEFDRIIANLSANMPPVDRDNAQRSWAIGREMLRNYPGSPALFAHTRLEDWYV